MAGSQFDQRIKTEATVPLQSRCETCNDPLNGLNIGESGTHCVHCTLRAKQLTQPHDAQAAKEDKKVDTNFIDHWVNMIVTEKLHSRFTNGDDLRRAISSYVAVNRGTVSPVIKGRDRLIANMPTFEDIQLADQVIISLYECLKDAGCCPTCVDEAYLLVKSPYYVHPSKPLTPIEWLSEYQQQPIDYSDNTPNPNPDFIVVDDPEHTCGYADHSQRIEKIYFQDCEACSNLLQPGWMVFQEEDKKFAKPPKEWDNRIYVPAKPTGVAESMANAREIAMSKTRGECVQHSTKRPEDFPVLSTEPLYWKRGRSKGIDSGTFNIGHQKDAFVYPEGWKGLTSVLTRSICEAMIGTETMIVVPMPALPNTPPEKIQKFPMQATIKRAVKGITVNSIDLTLDFDPMLYTLVDSTAGYMQDASITSESHTADEIIRVADDEIKKLREQIQVLQNDNTTMRHQLKDMMTKVRARDQRMSQMQSALARRRNAYKEELQRRTKTIEDLTFERDILKTQQLEHDRLAGMVAKFTTDLSGLG